MCLMDNIDIFQTNQRRFTDSIVAGTELFCVNWPLVLFEAPAMDETIPLWYYIISYQIISFHNYLTGSKVPELYFESTSSDLIVFKISHSYLSSIVERRCIVYSIMSVTKIFQGVLDYTNSSLCSSCRNFML